MFCPNCGKQLPDTANNCSECGASVNKNTTANNAAPAAATHTASATASYTAPAGIKLEKREYLLKSKHKIKLILSWLLGALCALIIFLGMNSAINGFFLDIPIVKMIVGEGAVDTVKREIAKVVDYTGDDIEDYIDEIDEDKLEEAEEELGITVDEVLDMLENPSIGNMSKIPATAFGMSNPFGAIKTIITVCAVILLLLTLLSTYFFKTGLLVFNLIISLPFYIFIAGTMWLVLALVLNIALAVILSECNKSYREYKRSL